jgi:GNAT superfamily N-acetyltransferase
MDLTFTTVDAGSDDARRALRRYFEELVARFEQVFDVDRAVESVPSILNPPAGRFVLARSQGEVVGCGGIHLLDETTAELRRMWIDPAIRGRGVGHRLLAHLEGLAKVAGCRVMLLDTNASLVEAVGLYRSAGYQSIERYKDNPDAHFWFRKHLGTSGAAIA